MRYLFIFDYISTNTTTTLKVKIDFHSVKEMTSLLKIATLHENTAEPQHVAWPSSLMCEEGAQDGDPPGTCFFFLEACSPFRMLGSMASMLFTTRPNSLSLKLKASFQSIRDRNRNITWLGLCLGLCILYTVLRVTIFKYTSILLLQYYNSLHITFTTAFNL